MEINANLSKDNVPIEGVQYCRYLGTIVNEIAAQLRKVISISCFNYNSHKDSSKFVYFDFWLSQMLV